MKFLLFLFLTLHLGEASGKLPAIVTSYADDLLCLPLILGGVLLAQRTLGGRGWLYTLPPFHGLLTFALYALYFEGILPYFQSSAVRDPWDILMYFVGFLCFEICLNHPVHSVNSESCPELA